MSGMYEDSFARARPNLAYSAVSGRLNLVRAVTNDLSSLLHERAEVEEQYIKGLQKLNSRLQAGSVGREVADLEGGERDLGGAWREVQRELEGEVKRTMAQHEQWKDKIMQEVEQPLRSSTGKGEWIKWDGLDKQLAEQVKEYQSGLEKVQKEQSKASKSTKSSSSTSSKLISAQSTLSSVGSSLTSSLPAFLSTSQQLELNHSAFLKEALIRAGTFTSDLGRERMEQGERIVAKVLGIEEDVEMQTWALREGMKAGGNGGGAAGFAGAGDMGAQQGLSEFGTQSQSIREESIAEEVPRSLAAPAPAERQRVPSISRTAPPPVAPLALPTSSATTTPSKEKKSSGGLKSLFKRNRDRSGSTASGGNKAASSKYGNLDVPSNNNNGSSSRQQLGADRQSLESRDSLQQPEEATAQPPRFDRQNSGASSLMGGGGSGGLQAPMQPQQQATKKRESLMPSFGGGSGGGGLFRRQSKMEPPSPGDQMRESEAMQQQQQQQRQPQSAQQVDEEGFSVPPAGYDRDITAAPAGGNNLMDDDEDEVGDMPSALSSSSRGLAPISVAPATITESEADRQAALARVQSTLLSSAPAVGGAGALGRRATRGRRDVRTTTYQPTIPDDVPLAQVLRDQRSREASATAEQSSTLTPPISPTGPSFAAADGRAMSIMSTTSSSHLAARHDPFAESTTPGLRASIVETVNVLSKAGEVQRVMITGEISLSHRPTTNAQGPMRIRIASFEQLEKAAPNSVYLQPIADSPGEYTVLPSLSSSSSTATVLKYQLHIPAVAEADFVPLKVKAAWQCVQGQTRVIVQYSSNPASALYAAAAAEASPFGDDDDTQGRLEDLTLALPVNSSVSTFSAKPTASWSAEKSRLTFALDPLSPTAGGEHKALASLTTEGTATPQPVAVGWKVFGKTVSRVGVEVLGAEGRVEEERRETRSGKYLAAP